MQMRWKARRFSYRFWTTGEARSNLAGMNVKFRKIEVDATTADALEAQAAAMGLSVSELLAKMLAVEEFSPGILSMRSAGDGPWSPDMIAEDKYRLTQFEQTREGVPWSEVRDWMQSWDFPEELPQPKSRKL